MGQEKVPKTYNKLFTLIFRGRWGWQEDDRELWEIKLEN